jgi:4-hydroxybenzoate polyprenyltransferase
MKKWLSGVNNFLLKTVRLAIYTNFYIALGAVAFAHANARLLGIAHLLDWTLWATIFFATLLVYQLSRWAFHRRDFSSPRIDSIYKWLEKSHSFTVWSMGFSASILFFLVQQLSLDSFILLIFLGSISVIYPLEWKWKGKAIRIRDIPYIKIFLIAIVWSGMAVLLPTVEAVGWHAFRWSLLVAFFLQIIYILMITLPFDINDWRVDKLTGVKTIPGVWGIRNAKYIVMGLSITYMAGFGIFLYFLPLQDQQKLIGWSLMFSLVISMLIKTMRYSSVVSKWKIMLWYDGSFFWYWLIVELISCI